MQTSEQIIKQLKDSIKNVQALENFMDGNVTSQATDYVELVSRFGINLLAVIILVRFIYYTTHKNKEFLFTFFLFNLLNFLI